MHILQNNPIGIKSFIDHCDNVNRNSILVGKCKGDCYYLSELTFKPVLINNNETLVNAFLKMHCKRVWGVCNCINICINNNDVSTDVNGEGDYEWDVTSLVKRCKDNNFKLCVYPKMWISHCGIKEFEAIDYNTMPVLEVVVKNELSNSDNNIVNIVNEYTSTHKLKHSEWIDCFSLNKYYYFIKNSGESEVVVSVEISPDKKLMFQDSEDLIVKAKAVNYLQPMR